MDATPVCLEYELDAVVPIPDLVADDEGIRATLSFSRQPHATFVPWKAVMAMAPMHAARTEKTRAKLRAV